ncbi:hypothetical protein F5984_16820 [Rudanella paleaurantiibacter]|uniref:Fibronectin type-III domain-containing protein n=1 Tax=Rudanella paleaurantiibacter TaxID=2614655 RepID=A0A7J5TXZ0_9BACT|nr:fibronectin type III domain-containing protein [Rudanella paleaurantiibacter]KAB7729293.1 hypothetical protein F5984_16820 [Rudanella paleaurantiibacter]
MQKLFTHLTYCLIVGLLLLHIEHTFAQSAPYNPFTSTISSTSAQLNWIAATSPTTYDVRWRQQGASIWIISSEIPTTTFGLTGLTDGQAYEWQMRPTGSATWYGGPVSFTTTYGCSPPSLNTPSSVSVTAAPLSWYFYSGSSGTTQFTVDLKTSESASWSSVSGITGSSGSTTYYTLSGLTPGTTYTYRVRSVCSPYSTTATFATPACTVLNPRQEPQPTQAVLRWPVTLGASYTLQWRPQGGDWATVSVLQSESYASTMSYSLTGLTPNATYEWRTQAVCGNTTGSFTAPLSFTASCNRPASLSFLAPSATQATIVWKSAYSVADYGYSYQVQYRRKNPTDSPWVTSSVYSNPNYNTPYDYSINLSGLTPETEYETRVQTNCQNTSVSGYTDPPVSFTTQSCTNTATNLRSSATYTFKAAYLSWNAAYDNYYAVQIRPSGVASWSTIGPSVYTGNSSQEIQNLKPETVYEWRVITYCTVSTSASAPSGTESFTTAACALNRIVNPYTAQVENTSARLNWSEISPVVGLYSVRYRPLGTATYTTLPPQTSQYLSLTGLQEKTAYEWQVSSVCTESPTSFSYTALQTFTTACLNPASYLRTNNNTIRSIELRWDNYYSSEWFVRTYTVRYRPQGAEWTTVPISTNSYSPVVSLTGLLSNTVYEWGVAYQCSASNSSTFTSGSSFSTTCRNALYGFASQNVTPTRADLNFSDSDYRNKYQIRYRVVGATDWILSPAFAYQPYALTGLTPYTAYEWQAASFCSSEVMSDFSPSQRFNSDCFVPTDLNVSTGGTSTYFYWKENRNVAGYTLQYRLQGTANWNSVAVPGASSINVAGLAGRYEWRVATGCFGGLNSDFSPIQTFSTYCSTPTVTSITAGSSYAATIAWNPGGVTNARYTLQWRPAGSTFWNTVADLPQSPYVLTGLVDNTSYEVQLQAQCNNLQSGYSSVSSFQTICSAPTGLSATGFYSYESVPYQNFSWTTAPNTSYNLRWRPITADNKSLTEWQVANDVQPSSRQFFATAGTYEWQVQSVCINGATSAFVGGKSFVVNDCETGYISYKAIAEANRALLSYSAFVNADVRWRPAGASVWNTIANVNVQSVVSLEGLTENTAYEWQVAVHCLSGQAPSYGPLQSFTTSCAPPTRLSTLCVGTNQASIAWAGPVGDFVYGQYEVSWRAVGAANWSSTQVETYIHSLTGLAPATNYEWRVRAVCSTSANAAFSQPQTFYTQCSQPTALTARSDCNSTALEWRGGCSPGTTYTVWIRVNYGQWTAYSTPYNSYYLYNLPSGAWIEYYVQSNCNGISSSTSNTYQFSASACPGPASCTLVSDLNQTVSANQAVLSWRTTNATSELQWRVVGGNWNSIVVSGTNFTLGGLANNALVEWKVRSTCAGANDFSPVSFFRTRCSGTFFISSIQALADTIKLYIVQPNIYEVRYRIGRDAWTTRSFTGAANSLAGLTPNTTYELQFRNACGNDLYSDWTPPRYITTSCPVLNRVYADRISETAARLTWSHASSPRPLGILPVIKYRVAGSGTWTTVLVSNQATYDPVSYTLTNLTPRTAYEWMVFYDCGNGNVAPINNQPLTFRTLGVAPPCNGMVTIQAGDWTNPAIWSCDRVPLITDPVLIRHVIMIPDRGMGEALQIRYEAGGLLRFGSGAKLVLAR